MLAEELDVLVGLLAGFVNGFGALAGTLLEVFLFLLDLIVKCLEDGQNGALQGSRGLSVDVRDTLQVLLEQRIVQMME